MGSKINTTALGAFAVYVLLSIAFGTAAVILGFPDDYTRALTAVAIVFGILILPDLTECANCDSPPGSMAFAGILAITLLFILLLATHVSPKLSPQLITFLTSLLDSLRNAYASAAEVRPSPEHALLSSAIFAAASIVSALKRRYLITAISLFLLLMSTALLFNILAN